MSQLTFPTHCTILLICVFFIYLATVPVAYSSNETDFHALVAFKNAIQSDSRGALNSWNEASHFCSWPGIFCSHKHQNRVVAINLTSQGLIGSISPHLCNLSFLRSLELPGNALYGQIPNEIGRLKQLEYVDFTNNSLSGEIPRNISRCANINHLNFNNNNLSGIIPVELSSLVKLQDLRLGKNQLSGTIPPFIGNFTSLYQLILASNRMQGNIPESFVQLKSLKYLFLGVNNLTGRIPHGLFNISTMIYFQVPSNRLEGTLPSDIGSTASKNLKDLNLWGNLFTGEIPDSLSNISSLEYLRLQKNNLKGRIKVDFSKLSVLSFLDLASNDFEGDLGFISSAINCSQLEVIDASFNQLSGLLPHSIANFSSQMMEIYLGYINLHGTIPNGIGNLLGLTYLCLPYSGLDGPIPSEISNLNNLQWLLLHGNMLTNEIPFSFGNLTSLSYVDLGQNNLSGDIPQSLGNCTKLIQLMISYNNLNGPIPQSICNCTNLSKLDISYNSLNGPIPPEIMSRATSLYIFDSSHNELTGSIPMEVGSLINLEYLDLSYNRLSGHVSDSLSSCLTLEEIYLQRNSFHGEISNALGKLRGLRRVDLSQNSLSGTIPTFLGELDLLYLNLSFNRLEGEVPSEGVFHNESAVSLEGNKDLCGGIPSLLFSPCALKNFKKKHFPLLYKILIPAVSVGSIALACYCMFICRKRKSKHAQTSDMVSLEEGYLRLSYADLQRSTDGFSESNLLGIGKFGSAYKGILHDDQTLVAVKVLHLNVKGASKSFISECNALRSKRHRNLLKILSVCSSTDFQENDFKALVYEFMANGNLDTWLHHGTRDGTKALSLRQRLDIAIDIASALEYLHVGTDSIVVHGDVKPSNILLDGDMSAHVGDFGLAKIVSDIFSTNTISTSVGIRGTIGYIPPECGISAAVSTQGDVYSYGILVLEMFTGRRPSDEEFKDSWALDDFVRNALTRQVMEVLDTAIIQEYNHRMDDKLVNCVVSILEIGLTCSMKLPKDRMEMSDVVNQLQKASQILSQS